MSQRLIAFAAVVAGTACLATAGLAWRILDQSREQHRELVDLLSAKSAREMPEKVEASNGEGTENRPAANSDWQPLRVILKTVQGQPVSATVTAHGMAIAGGKVSETLKTDAAGVADFGPLPAGEYNATYVLDDPKVHSSKSFLLGPGRPNEMEILCPGDLPGTFPVTFEIQPPASLAEVPLFYFAHVNYKSMRFNGERWRPSGSVPNPVLLLDSRGAVLGQVAYDKVTFREPAGSGYFINFIEKLPTDFVFEPAQELQAYELTIDLWPLVKDPEASAPADADRPPLRRLSAAVIQGGLDVAPEAGQAQSVRVDESRSEFWRDVKEDLRRMPAYKTLASTSGRK